MDIKKKNKRASKKKQPEPDLSFLKEENPMDVNEIEQPQHLTYKLGSALKQRSVIEAAVAILLFSGGLALGMQFSLESDPVEVASVAPEPVSVETQVAGEQDRNFPPDIYHRLELVSGDIYYSLITETDDEFYKLYNVFYTIEEADTEGERPKITLAMYEQALDQPAGELLLPSDQVKSVSQLASDSSIVIAIDQYVANLSVPEDAAEEEIPEE